MPNIIKSTVKSLYYSRRLNRYALKILASLSPPPYLRDNVEFYYDMWVGISSFYADSGRQIGENNTAPRRYKENLETLHKPYRFEGSRNGLLVNMTALRHVMSVWDEAVQLTTALRNDYMRHRNLEDARFNLRQGYVFSKIGAALPSYLARRSHNPVPSGSLPPLETAFYTLGVGVFMTVRKLLEAGDLTALDEKPMSAERLYELTENSGALVSAEGKGCAGSKKMIIEYLDVAMNGSYRPADIAPDVRRCIANLGAMEPFYDYLYAASRLELFIILNHYLTATALYQLRAHAEHLADGQRALLQQSLQHFSEQFAIGDWEPAALHNTIEIILSLLEELECTTVRAELDQRGLLDNKQLAGKDQSVAPRDAIAGAARAIRAATALAYEYCVAELSQINRALGRDNSHSISLEDMYARANGKYIRPLVDSIDRQSA